MTGQSLAPPKRIDANSNNGAHSRQVARHLSLLLDVIRSRRWSAFEFIVLSSPAVFRAVSSLTDEFDIAFCPTLLHACLPHDPPPEIVLKMIAMTPDRRVLLRAQDRAGRTPLHIAAAGRDAADPRVIKILGSADPTTCSMLDECGRTPLHLACDASCDDYEEIPGRRRGLPSYNVVRALLSECIAPASIEDDDGMSPLELAILSDASLEIVHLLQKATVISHQEREGRAVMAKSSNIYQKRGFSEVVGVVPITGTLEDGMCQGIADIRSTRQRVSVSIDPLSCK